MKKGIRRCVQCRTLADRENMIRLQLNSLGLLQTQIQQTGRSYYLCKDSNCVAKAARNKLLLKIQSTQLHALWREWCIKQACFYPDLNTKHVILPNKS